MSYGIALALEITHRVDRRAVYVHFEVQVGAGGDAGGAGIADRIAGADALADVAGCAGQMLVQVLSVSPWLITT